MTRSRVYSALALALLPISLTQAQTLEWIKPSLPSVPAARCCANLTYDANTRSAVLFGGGTFAGSLNDTWVFTRVTGWKQLFPLISPPPTSGAGFAYDPISKTAVLFGGNPGNFVYSNETWTWDGIVWTQQFPPVSPPARAFNSNQMAYDAETGSVVLFGGYANGGSTRLGDTWVWHGASKTWEQRFPATSPSARGTTLAYDYATKKVVLFGGDPGGAYQADTWEWNGDTWIERHPPAAPSSRAATSLAYDAAIGKLVLFGGATTGGNNNLGDTWTWNGITWTQVQTPFAPYPRSAAAMIYEPGVQGLLLFSGALANGSIGNDTWYFLRLP